MSTLAVIQARAGSTRLPGKVLLPLAGRPLLGFMLARLEGLGVDWLVVATSVDPRDDDVAAVAHAAGAPVVRGSEADVLARFVTALDAYPASMVVRLTGDCPLVDPAIVNHALTVHTATGADYTSNTLVRTFPDGLDVEVIAAAALRAAAAEATDPIEREHVTPFVYRRPERFRLRAFTGPDFLGGERWTVDTDDDLDRISAMVAAVPDPIRAGWREILAASGGGDGPSATGMTIRPGIERDDDGTIAPAMGEDPGWDPSVRVWIAERGDRRLGWAELKVRAGVGRLRLSIDPGYRDELLALVRTALRADFQVRDLIVTD